MSPTLASDTPLDLAFRAGQMRATYGNDRAESMMQEARGWLELQNAAIRADERERIAKWLENAAHLPAPAHMVREDYKP